MIGSKWTPTTEEEDHKEEAIPMWVHLEKVPLHMYSWEELSFITSTVGFSVKPHLETTACTNLDEAKKFVRVDVTKVLPKEITFTKEGKQFTVKFYYPWLPASCKLCDKWGHSEAVCATKGKGKKNRNASRSPVQVSGVKATSPESVANVSVVANGSVGREVEGSICKEVTGGVGNGSIEKKNSQKKEKGVAGPSEWSMVSTAKSGRSLFISTQKEEVEISASKFSVLSVDETEEGELIEDKLLTYVDDGNDGNEGNEEMEIMENDLMDDNILDQQIQEEIKVGSRRGRKPKGSGCKSREDLKASTQTLIHGDFFWNVQGFNKYLKHSVVEDWVRRNNMNFGCILETRVKESKSESILKKVFIGWSYITNYEYSRGRRIWFVWRDNVCVTPVYKSGQLIICSVGLHGREEFFYPSVYANNLVEERKEFWEDLCHHQDSAMFSSKPWMIVGDFNEILEGEKNSGFMEYSRVSSGMTAFQKMALHCKLSDMGYQGPLFTWCNKREEGAICKKTGPGSY